MPYSLRLIEDTLAPGARYKPALGSAAGVLYLAAGDIHVEGDGDAAASLESGRARFASKPSAAVAGASGAACSASSWSVSLRLPRAAGCCSSTRWPSILTHRGSCAAIAWILTAVASPCHTATGGAAFAVSCAGAST